MTNESSLPKMKLTPHVVSEQMRVHGWNWRSGGAVCGLSLGFISPVIGSILTAIAWFTDPEWQGLHLHRLGTVLFVLTIPLLAFGAHCLDLSDRQDKETRKRHSN
jgi:hypothetical protein